jgi:hypothetical protein
MDIQSRKYRIIEKVMYLNEEQLESLEATLNKEVELDLALDKSIRQVEKGKVKPHTEIRKKYQKWL